MPVSQADRTPSGVLVVTGAAKLANFKPRAVPFGLVGEKLYLPVDAGLHPVAFADEVTKLCGADVMVWHPGIGLVRFEPGESLKLWQLLEKPVLAADDWNHARVGGGLPPRIVAIRMPVVVKPMEEIFAEERKEFGTKPLSELPPSGREPDDGVIARINRAVVRKVAEAIRKLTSGVPASGTKRTWVNAVEDWANRKRSGVLKDLDLIRHKEILRLLAMLEEDPEAGLRYAIPMSGFQGRGIAPPAAQLGDRRPDFNLGRLGGGKPVDNWKVGPDLYAKLRAQYVDLANKEIALGRHRRAAYILAELLGDLNGAASTLKQGKHFREAALMHRDYLNEPVEAANCFAKAGMIQDAAVIYAERQMFVELGDMYARVEDRERARHAYERAVDKEVAAGHRVKAAELSESKLGDPEKAWSILEVPCKRVDPDLNCIRVGFDLMARHQWHQRSHELLDALRYAVPSMRVEAAACVLVKVSQSYPDRLIRHEASDLDRVLIGWRLERASTPQKRELVLILSHLAPEDRLLPRDGQRYLCVAPTPHVAPTKAPPKADPAPVKLAASLGLESGVTWEVIRSVGMSGYYAAGRIGNAVEMVRSTWQGDPQSLLWTFEGHEMALMEDHPLVLAVGSSTGERVILVSEGMADYPDQTFPVTEPHFDTPVLVGRPSWYPGDVSDNGRFLPCAISGGLLWILRHSENRVSLESWRLTGELSTTHLLEVGDEWRAEHLVVGGQKVAFSIKNILWYGSPDRLHRVEFDQLIIGLADTPGSAASCFIIMLERGLKIWWHGRDDMIDVDVAMDHPRAVMTRNGDLIVQDDNEVRVHRVKNDALCDVRRCDWKYGRTIGLVPGKLPNQFASFHADGKLNLFDVISEST
jgi:tetratricopeptide (TPR) repeat protein